LCAPHGEVARVTARIVTAAIRTIIGESELAIGIVACLQTHGSRANWHPPLAPPGVTPQTPTTPIEIPIPIGSVRPG